MTRKWYRKMILSGLILVLIFIRHTVVSTYEDDDGRKLSYRINQQPPIHQQHSRIAQHALALPHRYRHHHHDDYMQHKSNREMHIKSQHSHFYRDRDYRPTTKATTRTPTTMSWKLSSATAANLRLVAELTHFGYQGGNETNGGSIVPNKNRLGDGERLQQWSVNNKRIFIGPYQVKMNNDDAAPTSTSKTEHNLRSSWSYYKSHPFVMQQQFEEPHLKVEDNRNRLLGKTSRIDVVDPEKISHDDPEFKSKADYNEDYDGVDYYEEVDENEEGIPGNKIEERNNRRQEDGEAEDVVSEYKIEGKLSRKDDGNNEQEVESKSRYTNDRQKVEDDYSSEYVDDEPDPLNDGQNQTASLTETKWNNYGSAVAVARSRQQYLNSPQNKVDAHIQRLKEEGKCRWPHPKVIPLIDASNRYIPHCTILHRCADDTGCCDDDKKKCVAKRTTSVDLYFYVIPIDNHSKPSIEVRKFDNHTECQCVDKNRHRRTLRHNVVPGPNSLTPHHGCRCPSLFNVVIERAQCQCDCIKWNQGCNFLKEGKEGFPIEDQICISENKCQKPICEYGSYNKHTGRCPKLRAHTSRINNYR